MTAAAKSHYDVLGVSKTASADEIKKAFRRLARKHHPDAGGAEERFKEVSEAYEVLSDPEKRKQYDQFGQYFGGPGAPGGPGGPGPGWPGGAGGPGGASYQTVDLGDLGDLFGSVFTGGGVRAQRGRDLSYEASVSWDEAMSGVSTKVDVRRQERCDACAGSGAAPGTTASACPACAGTGRSSQGQGLFAFSRACQRCGGSGHVVEHPCATCRGKGEVVKLKPVTVQVPAGATDGGRLRFKGKGEPGTGGGPAGDLYVTTRIRKHPYFTREGADVILELPVTVDEAALGAEMEIPTPDGRVKLKVAAGTQDGKVYKLAGKGAPKLKGSGRGDMKVRVKVAIPKALNAEQKELLRRFASSRGEDVRAHLAK